jgi:serine/threonine protein kinase
MAEMSEPVSHLNSVDEILADYYSAVDAGKNPDPQDYLERYPEHRQQLEEHFAAQGRVEEILRDAGGPAGGAESRTGTGKRLNTNWQPGDRIGDRWKVQQVLGGGMGIVYVVKDEHTGEQLAAKTYRDDVLAMNPSLAARFEREALAWVNLDSHPNIVKARYVETSQQKPILFLEYVSGGNLHWLLPYLYLSKIPLFLIRELAIDFCEGMIHAANCGIAAHRDIKAQNCLLGIQFKEEPWDPYENLLEGKDLIREVVRDFGERPWSRGFGERTWSAPNEKKSRLTLRITDFGLAKIFDEEAFARDAPFVIKVPDGLTPVDPQSLDTAYQAKLPEAMSVFATRTGVGAGTPSHMAPEQFDDLKRVDVRADIYSFGVMLFQMITGELPFTGGTWLDYRRQHQTAAPPKLSSTGRPRLWPPDLAADLSFVVDSCLAKAPNERFRDFMELRDVLLSSSSYPYETYVHRRDRRDLVAPTKLTDEELLEKARSLVVLKRYMQALQVFNKLIKRNRRSGNIWFEKGLLLMNVLLSAANHQSEEQADDPTAIPCLAEMIANYLNLVALQKDNLPGNVWERWRNFILDAVQSSPVVFDHFAKYPHWYSEEVNAIIRQVKPTWS